MSMTPPEASEVRFANGHMICPACGAHNRIAERTLLVFSHPTRLTKDGAVLVYGQADSQHVATTPAGYTCTACDRPVALPGNTVVRRL
ncbi:hypothetical protein OHA25_61155 (plasmid) [Nonomuraea sp. NBC_00507]|uniref:hypothetical protein n=1 Tax=Nonomuraea sp. NBC_00507 TaxID=2976002 RepID=UPI002E177796